METFNRVLKNFVTERVDELLLQQRNENPEFSKMHEQIERILRIVDNEQIRNILSETLLHCSYAYSLAIEHAYVQGIKDTEIIRHGFRAFLGDGKLFDGSPVQIENSPRANEQTHVHIKPCRYFLKCRIRPFRLH